MIYQIDNKTYKDNKVDCHLHTSLTDGCQPIEEVVEQAKKNRLKKVIITDHNSFHDPERIKKLNKKDIIVEQGVEIWTSFRDENFHLLGYGLDVYDKKLKNALQPAIEEKNRIAKEVLRKYEVLGIKMPSFEEIRVGSYRGINHYEKAYVGTKDIAMARHIVHGIDFEEAVCECGDKKYTGVDTPIIKVRSDFRHMGTLDAIKLVQGAGGKAVIAHPGFIFYNSENSEEENWGSLAEMFDVCNDNGLDGVEVVSLWHKKEFSYDFFEELKAKTSNKKIERHKKLIYDILTGLQLLTRGSDHHGICKEDFQMDKLLDY